MLNSVLRHFQNHKPRPFSEYIEFKETLNGAKAAGLGVGDYIERTYCPGAVSPAEFTVMQMAELGVFDPAPERICEIGPGSGRYLQRVYSRAHPYHYEIYETASEWRNWLVKEQIVVAKPCDGRTLSGTETGSIDLVHTHKLFPGLPFLVTLSYLREMARIAKPGGWVVFDILTEENFTPDRLQAWLDANVWSWSWSPHIVPKDFTIKLLADLHVNLVDSFLVPLHPGDTECMVFRKAPIAPKPTS
jgi:SAM-dependent methyltransferase